MPEAQVRYRKLPGRRSGVAGITRLWEGGDHLLVVSSVFGAERYRRFYLRDIQAIVLQRTSTRLVWNLVLGGIGGLGALGTAALAYGASQAASRSDGNALTAFAVMLGIFAGACLVGLLINTLLGASCKVFIQTTARLEELGVPGRVPAARRLIRRLTPLIEQTQSATPEQATEPSAAIS